MGTGRERAPHFECDFTGDFLWASQKAISAYADVRLSGIAQAIRRGLLAEKPSSTFDLPNHKDRWAEFRYQAHFGPGELEAAFEQSAYPLIQHHLDSLTSQDAVLLSVAEQWKAEELECQNGSTIAPDLLRRATWLALRRLALNEDCDPISG